ncbi:MAG: tetratricopeptide repeat protein [Chloroflexi bacterium]|nr:tetratricopeptide repeat protein [Chloroflexota bacterium]
MHFCGKCGIRLEDDPLASPSISAEASRAPVQIGDMVGADLRERFRRAGLESAGQRRNVTVLFVELSGFTAFTEAFGSEASFDLVQKFARLMAQDVYKYDGMVDRFIGDGLMAIFGAPIASENPAELALRSALDMRQDLTQLNRDLQHRLSTRIDLHIGLHSGPVVVGGIVSDLLMDYTAIGDTVNLAARLLEAAPAGAILASETVFQQTRSQFEFQALPPLTLKGITPALQAFTVSAIKIEPGPRHGIKGLRAPMVGRQAELTELLQAGNALITRKEGSFVFIQGEAGIGKSRLFTEFAFRMSQGGLRTRLGCSFTYRRSMSYWIFLDLLRDDLEIPANASEAQVWEQLNQKINALLGAKAAETLPYFEYLFSLKSIHGEGLERLRYLDAAQLRRQIFVAVRDLLVAEARLDPIVLVFEDLHWADETSLELLQFLVDSVRQEPILILAISRPTQEEGLRQLIETAYRLLEERFIGIQLHSLSPMQSEELLQQLVAIPNLPENLRAQIIQHSAGNPFYFEEIIRMLIDEKIIQGEPGSWSLVPDADLRSLEIPETLQALILARFDRLDEDQRRVLQIASLIGRDFNARLIQTVLQADAEMNVPSILAELAKREFILPHNSAAGGEYSFKHVLVSDAIYGTLLKSERSILHGQMGEAIEMLYTDRIDEQIELLARHYYCSARYDRALHYLILAGQKAARGYANQQARRHFEQALEVLSKVAHGPEPDLQVYLGLGDVQALTGEYPASRASYQSALEHITGDDPRSFARERSNLQRKIGTTYERQGEYAQALSYLASAKATLDYVPGNSPVERAWILNDTGWIHFRRGNPEAAEMALLEGLNLVEDSPQYDLVASIYNRLGGVYYQKDMLEQASNYVRKSLFLRQEIGDVNAVARSYNNLGLLRWKRGDWDSALDNFMRSLILHANLGDVEGTLELHSNLGLLELDRGNFEEAKKHLDSSLETARQIGHSYHIGLTYLHFSRLHVALEEWDKALDYSTQGLKIFNEIGAMEYLVDLNTYTGLAWLGKGDLAQARRYGGEALGLFDRLNPGKANDQAEDRGRALRLLGQVALAEKDYRRAEEMLQESAEIFKSVGSQIEQGRTAYIRAAAAAARSDVPAARLQLVEARLAFRQLGARIDLRRVDALSLQLNS